MYSKTFRLDLCDLLIPYLVLECLSENPSVGLPGSEIKNRIEKIFEQTYSEEEGPLIYNSKFYLTLSKLQDSKLIDRVPNKHILNITQNGLDELPKMKQVLLQFKHFLGVIDV